MRIRVKFLVFGRRWCQRVGDEQSSTLKDDFNLCVRRRAVYSYITWHDRHVKA